MSGDGAVGYLVEGALFLALLLLPTAARRRRLIRSSAAARKTDAPAAPATAADLMGRELAAVDVETTGLDRDDRIVSIGCIRIRVGFDGSITHRRHHLVVDPGRPSHPAAERIHGYDDWYLRHQPPFADCAAEIHDFLAPADLLIGHNVEFDLAFINRELVAAGQPPLTMATHCTLQQYRRHYPGSPAKLDAALDRAGLARAGSRHSALEDAYLALRVAFFLAHIPIDLDPNFFTGAPENACAVPALAPRTPKPVTDKPPAETLAAGRRAKKAGELDEAIRLLTEHIDQIEHDLWGSRIPIRHHAYWDLAVIHRRRKDHLAESAVLARYLALSNRHPADADKMADRLGKLIDRIRTP